MLLWLLLTKLACCLRLVLLLVLWLFCPVDLPAEYSEAVGGGGGGANWGGGGKPAPPLPCIPCFAAAAEAAIAVGVDNLLLMEGADAECCSGCCTRSVNVPGGGGGGASEGGGGIH